MPAPLSDTRPVLANWSIDFPAGSSAEGAAVPDGGAGFKLAHPIGRGGFGEVWEAVQVSLGRVVAVKRLRPELLERVQDEPGRYTQLVLSFHQEAVTTASLEHPNIVPMYDLGRDAAGHPVLAMKRLRGRTWEEMFIDDFGTMGVGDLLARHLPILQDVAQAVAFAHSRGIVHRDLKPSQVMVGEFGEVLLLDWGLAVAFDPGALALTPQSGAQAFAPTREHATNPAGTTVFMAPEQTEPTAARIGPWTDVYLLGGTLYLLLTGSPPHIADDSQKSFFRASEGIVEPPERRNPGREVPRELSELAMRAMERLPERRVPSVRDFIAALGDFMGGASKRREAAALVAQVREELGRGVTDYRALAGFGVALARAEGLWPGDREAAQLAQQVIGTHARTALQHGDLTLARGEAERLGEGPERTALLSEIEGRQRALRATAAQRRLAIAAACIMGATLLGGGIKYSLAQSEAARAEAKSNARLRDQRERGDELLAFMLGELAPKLDATGRIAIMDETARRALAFHAATDEADLSDRGRMHRAAALRQVAFVLRRKPDLAQAKSTIDRARAIAEPLAKAHPDDPEFQQELASILGESATIRNNLGDGAGALADAARADEVGTRLLGKGAAGTDVVLGVISNMIRHAELEAGLADSTSAMRRYGEARALCERLRAQGVHSDEFMEVEFELDYYMGSLRAERGELGEGVAQLQSAIATMRGLIEREPGNFSRRFQLVQLLPTMTELLLRQGRREEALALCDEAVREARDLVQRDPENTSYSQWLGIALHRRGDYRNQFGDVEGSLDDLNGAVAQFERTLVIDRDFAPARRNLVSSLSKLAITHSFRGERPRSVELLERAAAEGEKLWSGNPGDLNGGIEYATVLGQLGDMLASVQRMPEAIARQEESLAVVRGVVARDPANAQYRRNLSTLCARMAQTYQLAGRKQEAKDRANEAVELMERILADTPENVDARREVAATTMRSAMILGTFGENDIALARFQRAADLYEGITRELPDNNAWHRELAMAHDAIGAELNGRARPDEALPHFERALELCDGMLKLDPNGLVYMAEKVAALRGVAEVHMMRREDAASLARLNEAVGVLEGLLERAGGDVNGVLRMALLLELRGRVHERLGDTDLARADWEDGVSRMTPIVAGSRDIRMLEIQAILLIRLGRVEEAAPLVEKLAGMQMIRPVLLALMKEKGIVVPSTTDPVGPGDGE